MILATRRSQVRWLLSGAVSFLHSYSTGWLWFQISFITVDPIRRQRGENNSVYIHSFLLLLLWDVRRYSCEGPECVVRAKKQGRVCSSCTVKLMKFIWRHLWRGAGTSVIDYMMTHTHIHRCTPSLTPWHLHECLKLLVKTLQRHVSLFPLTVH